MDNICIVDPGVHRSRWTALISFFFFCERCIIEASQVWIRNRTSPKWSNLLTIVLAMGNNPLHLLMTKLLFVLIKYLLLRKSMVFVHCISLQILVQNDLIFTETDLRNDLTAHTSPYLDVSSNTCMCRGADQAPLCN